MESDISDETSKSNDKWSMLLSVFWSSSKENYILFNAIYTVLSNHYLQAKKKLPKNLAFSIQ